MIIYIILALVVIVNGTFALTFFRDLMANKDTVMKEPGNPIALAIFSFIIFLLSSFGVSDFAIAAALYPKLKWVEDRKLPGTLNTECVIPVAFMALIYISSIDVGLATLIVPIVGQVTGSYLSPRYVVKLPVDTIKKFVSAGLFIAAGLILAGKFGIYPLGGDLTSLPTGMLILLGILSFVYGALNNIGIGSYALTMATVYAMGLNPIVAFPVMMGACTFSVPVGSMQFVKFDSYSRKITLFASTFGVIGVFVAAYIVKSLDVSALQWLVVIVVLYSAITMLMDIRKNKAEEIGGDLKS